MDEQQDLTIDQVAKIVQVNRKTVERWIRDGELDAYEVGNDRKRIKPAKLEEFKEKRRVRAQQKSERRRVTKDEVDLALAG